MTTIKLIQNGTLKADSVTPATVSRESYYNLVQLCRITGYSDPIAALKATGEIVAVKRDASGNILLNDSITLNTTGEHYPDFNRSPYE
jgi:hypothetical protein